MSSAMNPASSPEQFGLDRDRDTGVSQHQPDVFIRNNAAVASIFQGITHTYAMQPAVVTALEGIQRICGAGAVYFAFVSRGVKTSISLYQVWTPPAPQGQRQSQASRSHISKLQYPDGTDLGSTWLGYEMYVPQQSHYEVPITSAGRECAHFGIADPAAPLIRRSMAMTGFSLYGAFSEYLAREELDYSSQTSKRFFDILCHEMKTPLAPLLRGSEVLAREVVGEHRLIAREMISASRRLANQTDTIIMAAHIRSVSDADREGRFIMSVALQQFEVQVRHLSESRGVEIDLTMPTKTDCANILVNGSRSWFVKMLLFATVAGINGTRTDHICLSLSVRSSDSRASALVQLRLSDSGPGPVSRSRTGYRSASTGGSGSGHIEAGIDAGTGNGNENEADRSRSRSRSKSGTASGSPDGDDETSLPFEVDLGRSVAEEPLPQRQYGYQSQSGQVSESPLQHGGRAGGIDSEADQPDQPEGAGQGSGSGSGPRDQFQSSVSQGMMLPRAHTQPPYTSYDSSTGSVSNSSLQPGGVDAGLGVRRSLTFNYNPMPRALQELHSFSPPRVTVGLLKSSRTASPSYPHTHLHRSFGPNAGQSPGVGAGTSAQGYWHRWGSVSHLSGGHAQVHDQALAQAQVQSKSMGYDRFSLSQDAGRGAAASSVSMGADAVTGNGSGTRTGSAGSGGSGSGLKSDHSVSFFAAPDRLPRMRANSYGRSAGAGMGNGIGVVRDEFGVTTVIQGMAGADNGTGAGAGAGIGMGTASSFGVSTSIPQGQYSIDLLRECMAILENGVDFNEVKDEYGRAMLLMELRFARCSEDEVVSTPILKTSATPKMFVDHNQWGGGGGPDQLPGQGQGQGQVRRIHSRHYMQSSTGLSPRSNQSGAGNASWDGSVGAGVPNPASPLPQQTQAHLYETPPSSPSFNVFQGSGPGSVRGPKTPKHPPVSPGYSAGSGPSAAGAGAASPAVQSKGRVLLVEDNPLNARVTKAFLNKAKFSVTVAKDGLVALHMLGMDAGTSNTGGDHHYHACVMDYNMPGLDGLETTKRIRQWEADRGVLRPLPIIGLTANAMPDAIEALCNAGMSIVLSKDSRANKLTEEVERAVMEAK